MKELTLEEVLRIAGGVPPTAALDEVTYRTQDTTDAAAGDAAREMDSGMRPPQGA